MEQQILWDKNQYPSDEVIFSHIGKSKQLWISLFDYIHSNHPDFTEEWRYYNDGKSWLMKVQRKAKTVFWLSLFEKTFRISFYFTDRAEKAILESDISDELKDTFTNGKSYGKLRGMAIVFKKKKDIEYAKTLIGIKLSVK
jgi:hypothetical protein